MTTITFYDSAHPGEIPAGAHALLYRDGLYTPTPAQVKRLGPVRWITVLGGAAVAAHAGAADYEPGNDVFSKPGALREWAEARLAMKCRARVYTDGANAAAAHALVGHLPNVVWWLATLDGTALNAEQCATRLASHGAPVPAGKVWANQFKGGPAAAWDESILLGTW